MQKRQKSNLIVAVVIICFFVIGFYILILSGNSGFAQQYKFNVSKKQLITAIEDFKNNNKEFEPPPNYKATDYLDTLTTEFVAYVYYQNENAIVCFFINNDPNEYEESYVNLLSINEGLYEPTYKLVNKDFGRNENLRIKKEFKERILNKLKLEYKDKGNNNFIFWK